MGCGATEETPQAPPPKPEIITRKKPIYIDIGQNPTDATQALYISYNKCIFCNNCVELCEFHILSHQDDAFPLTVPGKNQKKQIRMSLNSSDCISCGACVLACPTGAIQIKETIDNMQYATSKIKIAVISPMLLPVLQDKFGPKYTLLNLISFLKSQNFQDVFDASFGVDLTVKEEVSRIVDAKKKGKFIISSQCSGLVQLVERKYPEFVKNISTIKNCYNVTSAYIKSIYAREKNIDSENIFVVHFTPCLVEKDFNIRKQAKQDTDLVISVVELIKLMENFTITSKETEFAIPNITRLAKQFQISGHITGLISRTLFQTYSESFDMSQINISTLQKFENFDQSIKLVSFTAGNFFFTIAVANGSKAVLELLDQVKSGKLKVDYIEGLVCHGGCANGGGMPQNFSFVDILARSELVMKWVKGSVDINDSDKVDGFQGLEHDQISQILDQKYYIYQ